MQDCITFKCRHALNQEQKICSKVKEGSRYLSQGKQSDSVLEIDFSSLNIYKGLRMTSLLAFSTLQVYVELKKKKCNKITEKSNWKILLPYLHIPIQQKCENFKFFLIQHSCALFLQQKQCMHHRILHFFLTLARNLLVRIIPLQTP